MKKIKSQFLGTDSNGNIVFRVFDVPSLKHLIVFPAGIKPIAIGFEMREFARSRFYQITANGEPITLYIGGDSGSFLYVGEPEEHPCFDKRIE